jgi:hypothetical protein
MEYASAVAHHSVMDYEYAPLRIPSNIDRAAAVAQLTIAAEFSDWELAKVKLLRDGTRQVLLRRRHSGRPLPGVAW